VTARGVVAALALALALPALAYVPAPAGILRRMGERRAELSLAALEVTGTLQLEGRDASRLLAGDLVRGPQGQVSAPARFLMKVPGRCRLELTPAGVAAAARPFVSIVEGRVGGHGGLEQVPAAVALVRSACALLGVRVGGDASGAYAAALSRRGVALGDATLGRFDGRLAYVIGGRARDAKPLVFVDKDTFQPLRLVSPEGAALLDVRLLGWGSPTGGDAFPRAVEVLEGDALRLRFTTERAAPNARLGDVVF
jgi:hypothetical protein